MDFPSKTIIAVAGPIAAGKTTLSKALSSELNLLNGSETFSQCSEEQVPQELLTLYIENPVEYAAHFQTVMVDRAAVRRRLAFLKNESVLFIERDLEENVVFAQANALCGNFPTSYYEAWYRAHFAFLMQDVQPVRLYIYLYVKPQILEQRRGVRARPSEDLYADDYLNCVGDVYFHWVMRLAMARRILVLDWNTFQSAGAVLERIHTVIYDNSKLPSVSYEHASIMQLSHSIGEIGRRAEVLGELNNVRPSNMWIDGELVDTMTPELRCAAQAQVLEKLARLQPVNVRC